MSNDMSNKNLAILIVLAILVIAGIAYMGREAVPQDNTKGPTMVHPTPNVPDLIDPCKSNPAMEGCAKG